MALQNQTAFASAVPSASPTSAYSVSSNLTNLIVLASNDNPGYENNYYEDNTYNAAPPSLSYSVQQAINFGNYIPGYFQTSGEGQYTLRLAADGCRQSHSSTEDVVYDCSISCVSPKDMFKNMPTMANCMAYGLIADALFSSNVSDSFKQTAMKYGISANRTTVAQVRSTILSCFNQCKSFELCGFRSGSSNYDSLADASLSLYDQVADICLGVTAPVQTDIAGIGIYIAYWLQSGIALTAFSLLKLYDFWIYYIVICTLIWRRGFLGARSAALRIRRKARERALPRLVTALVEFQKAQCYFMLAVQIAAIVTISKGQSQANNLQQLYNNWEVVHVISISGFVPTTFILLCLQSVGKRSWYLTILSTITVGISTVTLFMTGSFSPSQKDTDYLAKQSSAMDLRGNQDPTLYCLERYMDTVTLGNNSTTNMMIFSLVVLVYLIVNLLPISESSFYNHCRAYSESSKAFRFTAGMVARTKSMVRQYLDFCYIRLMAKKETWNPSTPLWILKLRNALAATFLRFSADWRPILVLSLYASAWGVYLAYISDLLSYFQLFLINGMINFTWNFGQIVGITVWAEPLVEYAYLELKGMSAANYRFLPPWTLVKVQEQSPSADKAMEEPSWIPIPSIRKNSMVESSPNVEIRSSYSFDQDEGLVHREDEQYADIMAQRLL